MNKKRWLLLLAVACMSLLVFLMLPGCGKARTTIGEEKTESEAENQAETQEAEGSEGGKTATLTLYFIKSSQTEFFLVPEKRTIPYTQAVARAAMEELIKGPSEGSELLAAFPATVKVLDVSIEDGVCTVNVSKEILTDKAKQGGAGAAVEGLALISIANTLTEFPTVQRVKLLIEGKQRGMVDGLYVEDFWGHVGLPEYLERDMSAVKSP
ncbi:MAG: GerMN domain-containing protein [Actinomycetota bacterium]